MTSADGPTVLTGPIIKVTDMQNLTPFIPPVWGFQQDDLLTRTRDGLNHVLKEYLYYTAKNGKRYRMQIGATTDGASSPRVVWIKIPPFGVYWLGAVLHDGLFRGTVETWNDATQEWELINYDEDFCNDLLYEAMKSLGTDHETAWEIFEAVHWGGKSSFDEDRKELVQP